MTTGTADVIVIGGGIMGTSTAFNLARLGAGRVVLLERSSICSGGTAKSCAITRTHYSVRANMVHAVESLKIFEGFRDAVGGECGFHRTGYLILGPEEHRRPMEEVFRQQNDLGIDTALLTHDDAGKIHPLLSFDGVDVIGYDTRAGYCDPHLTTTSYVARAKELGARVYTDAAATDLRLDRAATLVQTRAGRFEAPRVVLACGPWTNGLARTLGLEFPYAVSRHKVITLRSADQPYDESWPTVKDLTTPDKIYFRPEAGGGVLVGTGDHGDPVEDADGLTDDVETAHAARMAALMARRMPTFADARLTAGWTGPYDITPDWNPIAGPVPGWDGLFVTVGFSGHGFKLAPTIGESLAQAVLGLPVRVPIEPYSLERFRHGRALHGAYGNGSIS